MTRARQNPLGTEAPAGVRVVRVGDGAHTHVHLEATDRRPAGLLCGSGIGKRGRGKNPRPIELFDSKARFVTCYRCQKLLRGAPDGGPLLRQVFYPSHPEKGFVPTKARLEAGPDGQPLGRRLHLQIKGGHRETRAPGEPDPQTKRSFQPISPKTEKRLFEKDPDTGLYEIPGVRTQAVETRGYLDRRESEEGILTGKIRTGLNVYRAQESGTRLDDEGEPEQTASLNVPFSAAPLISAGVPKKPAEILVERARGAIFVAGAEKARALPKDMRLLLGFIIGIPHIDTVTGTGGKRTELHLGAGDGLKVQSIILVGPKRPNGLSLRTKLFDADDFSDEHFEQLRSARRRASAFSEKDFNQTFATSFWRDLDEAVRQKGSADSILLIRLSAGTINEERQISLREHSNFQGVEASKAEPEYRSLRDVSLSELPRLLARLALRRSEVKGRRLPPVRSNPDRVRTNPMTNMIDILAEPEDGTHRRRPKPGAMVPVPGKPGRVYVWSGKKQMIVETSERRAAAWGRIGDAGRENAEGLRAAASASPRQTPESESESDHPEINIAQENPSMARYNPYGALALENPRGANKSKAKKPSSPKAAAWRTMFGQITRRAQAIQASSGCQYKRAFDQARAELQGSRANPFRRNPDEIEEMERHFDPDSRVLELGPQLFHPDYFGHRAESRLGMSVPPRWSQYEQVEGPFGAGATIPANRRNPKGVTVSRFPGTCCVCGREMARGSQICDSGMRGPKGGKKMKHVGC